MIEKTALEVLENWLDSTVNFEKRPVKGIFWLETMEYLCKRFKNPEKAYKSIHIAGSKGKGSVSAFIASILEEQGLKTGLYSSPHILSLAERFGTAHGPFTEELYEKTVQEIIPLVDSIIPINLPKEREATWFELITLFAFLVFKNAKVDYGVFETGMGGRLDATNILIPEVSVITQIELEHTEYLGDTIEKIAEEKAGIIKEGIPVVLAKQVPEVKQVFISRCIEKQTKPYFIDDFLEKIDFSLDLEEGKPVMNTKLQFRKEAGFSRPLQTKMQLIGKFQCENAALAALTIKLLLPEISEETIEKGLAKTSLPGRFELLSTENEIPVVLDGAHTLNSLTFTLNTFYELYGKNSYFPHLLFACAADKKVEEMSDSILRSQNRFESITLTRPGEHKQSNLEKLSTVFFNTTSALNTDIKPIIKVEQDFNKAIKEAIVSAKKQGVPLLITGSFYLLAEVKRCF